MLRNNVWPCALTLVATLVAAADAARPAPLAEAPPLTDIYGERHDPATLVGRSAVVVAFLGVECPLAKLYTKRLQGLAAEYAGRGVEVVGVDSNEQDSLTELAAFARRHEPGFPLYKDPGSRFADHLDARRTPEVFVLDARGAVRYRGRVDDQYGIGVARPAPQTHFLRDALDAVLAGGDVATPHTDAVGCVIGRPREPQPDAGVTYSKQVARLFQQHCVECHREGEIAPFALTDYDEAAGWAETIAEVVREQRMPPWHADPAVAHYQNERLLTDEEKQLVYDWVAAGAPQGDPADAPPPRRFVEGWTLPREPDLVVPMRGEPYRVASEGVIEYQYFAVDPGLTEDRWVVASDIVPGARSAVHHVIVFVSPPTEGGAEGSGRRGMGWLASYVPGQGAMQLPPGHARLIPAGSKLIFQMHYTPVGRPQEDTTRLGLVFTEPESVEREVITLYAVNDRFEVPPGAAEHPVAASLDWFPAGAQLMGMGPHMHSRGRSFRFTGVWPDGRRETLLDVPHYDFNWQHAYRLAESMRVPPGFRVECDATFDNSPANPANPDPTASVRWGDQTFEEMMLGVFEASVPRGAPIRRAESPADRQARERRAREAAEGFVERFDADGDGRVDRRETPDTFAVFAFRRYDRDADRVITPAEAYETSLELGD